jgi:hypothetical protein
MATEYRENARSALSRARHALDSGDDASLRYVALELRMALECLVYERAHRYKEELSNKKLSTWQPKQLLNILLEIDPYADKTATISFGLEEEYGVPAKVVRTIGTDRVISLKEIKDYYDRIGSYLHTPTLEQSERGKGLPGEKLRNSCEDLFKIVESSLSSKVWNSDFKITSSRDCEDCGTKIVRRVRGTADSFEATCIECGASYALARTEDDKFNWNANTREIECANPACRAGQVVWQRDIALGKRWTCRSCGGKNAFVLGIEFSPKEES